MQQAQNEKIIIRDRRKPRQFSVENLIVDEYLPVIGPIGFALYSIYCRLASVTNEKAFPSTHSLRKHTSLSRVTIIKYNKLLEEVGLIKIIPNKRKDGGCTANIYYILDPQPLPQKLKDKYYPKNWRSLVRKAVYPPVQEMYKGGLQNEHPPVQEMYREGERIDNPNWGRSNNLAPNNPQTNNPKANNNVCVVAEDKKNQELLREIFEGYEFTSFRKRELQNLLSGYPQKVITETLGRTKVAKEEGKIKGDLVKFLSGVCRNVTQEFKREEERRQKTIGGQLKTARQRIITLKAEGISKEEIVEDIKHMFGERVFENLRREGKIP